MTEHTESRESRDSLDVISNAIIKETFLGYGESAATAERNERPNEIKENQEKKDEDDGIQCCSDSCFKWWFFHSSFQIPTKGDIRTDLLNQRKQFYCCDVCSECLEIKLLNYCASSKCMKEHCSDCFYNGCQLSCCCFTFILSSK
jgi:hypothetical protein